MRIARPWIPKAPATPRAFEELLSEHLDPLHRVALRLCGGRQADAEDLLQDAMLRAFRGVAELRDHEAGRAWLYTILVRTNLNRIRTSRRRAEQVASDLKEEEFEAALAEWRIGSSPEEDFDMRELRSCLTVALDALDEDLRTAVWLCDVEGLRQREVASIIGVPEGTVASRLFRARRELRTALAGEGARLSLGGER